MLSDMCPKKNQPLKAINGAFHRRREECSSILAATVCQYHSIYFIVLIALILCFNIRCIFFPFNINVSNSGKQIQPNIKKRDAYY